jgi:glycosyltransferase involved in cell wall biosynthesis
MDQQKISVIINTLNEEKNIGNCLESVKWADEIVVVDMHSDDKTVEIANRYTDKIFYHERTGYVEPAREFALQKASHQWALVIDADELVPIRLRDKIGEIIEEDLADSVYIPRNNYLFGHLMQGAGWASFQDIQPRLFKKGFVKFSEQIHSDYQVHNNPRIFKINNPKEGFIHFNYIDIEEFIDMLNRYTTIEAQNINKGLKVDFNPIKLIFQVIKDIMWRFISLKGYKDGIQGFYLSGLMGAYLISTFAKLCLMKKFNSIAPREEIVKLYADITHKILGEYKEGKSNS